MDTFPVLRLELQGMKHTLAVALHEYVLTMDRDIQRAIEAYCMPENLVRVIAEEVSRTLGAVIQEEVEHYFRLGNGRKIIRDAIEHKLDQGISEH